MGGELPTLPSDPHEPSVQEWGAFMQAIATAPDSAIMSMVIQDATGNPTVADFRVPCRWVSVSPRFQITPPVVEPPTPPPPVYDDLYVISVNGLKIRNEPTVTSLQIGTLTYGASAKVTGSTVVTEKDAGGATVTYHWGKLNTDGYVAREFLGTTRPT